MKFCGGVYNTMRNMSTKIQLLEKVGKPAWAGSEPARADFHISAIGGAKVKRQSNKLKRLEIWWRLNYHRKHLHKKSAQL